MIIDTTHWNQTKLIMQEYSENIKYKNGYGVSMDINQGFVNLECNTQNRFVKFDQSNQMDSLDTLVKSRYNSGTNLPCDGVKIECEGISECEMILFYRFNNNTKPSLDDHGNGICFYADVDDLVSYRCINIMGECSNSPTSAPTGSPTRQPTLSPSKTPTQQTLSPSQTPTMEPTVNPTRQTISPSESPTIEPTPAPTVSPTPTPTNAPTEMPSNAPSNSPTISPTPSPTDAPTIGPTNSPTSSPTVSPTDSPTPSPTRFPTEKDPFFGFINPMIVIANISDEILFDMYNIDNINKYLNIFNFVFEEAIFNSIRERYNENLRYFDFDSNILKFNDQKVTDPAIATYIPRDNIVYMDTNITCNRDIDSLTCRLILQILRSNTEAFVAKANIALHDKLDDNNVYLWVNSPQELEIKVWIPEPETFLFVIFMAIFGGCIILITILAFLYNNGICKRCSARCHKTDMVQWSSLLKWGFQVCILVY